MRRHLASELVGLIGYGLHLFARVLGRPGLIALRQHAAGSADLDQVSAVFDHFTDLSARRPGSVRDRGIGVMKFRRQQVVIAVSSCNSQRRSRHKHPGALDIASFDSIAQSAGFNGIDVIGQVGGGAPPNVQVLSSVNRSAAGAALTASAITITAADLSSAGLKLTGLVTDSGGSSANLSRINSALTTIATELANLGTVVNALTNQQNFINSLTDSLTSGVGNLVDGDLAADARQWSRRIPEPDRLHQRLRTALLEENQAGGFVPGTSHGGDVPSAALSARPARVGSQVRAGASHSASRRAWPRTRPGWTGARRG